MTYVVKPSAYMPKLLAISELEGGQLMPHQLSAMTWFQYLKRGRGRVLADSVGAGKTVTAMALIDQVLTRTRNGTVLILVPANLADQWEEQLARFLPTVKVHNLARKGRKSQGVKGLVSDAQVWIASHESNHKVTTDSWDLVIVDELAQVGKISVSGSPPCLNHDRPKGLTSMANIMPRDGLIVGMSATMAENDAAETWGYLNAINAEGLPPWQVWRQYLQVEDRGTPVVTGVTDAGRVRIREILGTNLPVGHPSQVVMVRGPESLDLALPRRADPRRIFIPLLPDQQQAYNAATASGLPGHQQRERISRSHNGRSALVNAVVAELLTRPPWEKAIVYAENLAVLDLAEQELDRVGISHCRIDGRNPGKRQDVIASHKDPQGPRVMSGTKVLERGMNLHYCNVMLSMDPTYNPASEMQREGRICRIGSPHDWYQHIVYLPDVPHVHSKVATLQRKHDVAVSLGLAEA